MSYKPLTIKTLNIAGKKEAFKAMRLPIDGNPFNPDEVLVADLIRRGDSHAKCVRGVIVWAEMSFQAGWMIELDTYRHGREVLSTSSSMHNELKHLGGADLASKKQRDLVNKYYTQICTFSYQALRRIWIERRKHRHPDWQIFCDWVETLPDFGTLIIPEKGGK